MIDRLRAFLNRPLRETDRPRIFALAVALMLSGAALLALLDDPAARPAQQAPRATPERAAQPPLPDELPAAPAVPGKPPSEEGKPTAALAVSRAQVTAATRSARRFLTGYLPYSYGRRGAAHIPAAAARLRARLARERPRVPRDMRHRQPRVVLLHGQGVAARSADVVALVSDGARSYSVQLELKRAPAGWRVTDVRS